MEVLHENSLLLIAALVAAFWFGFAAGKWWERVKDAPPPQDHNDIWW